MTEQEFTGQYMAHFNAQQKAAVKAVDGAALLLAVPGSGKTTVLVTRLGYMILCRGIAPSSILTMTYTVAATRDMRQRFSDLFGQEPAAHLDFFTINSFSNRVLRYYSRNHSNREPFRLISSKGEAWGILGRIYQDLTGEYATVSILTDLSNAITYIKNMMMEPDEIQGLVPGIPQLAEIFKQYNEELRRTERMDFDDQLIYALEILQHRPKVLQHFQDKYRYLAVDEAQDTSKLQHAIIRFLARRHGNLFMVGDEDQSIYGFRGAYPEALMEFDKDHPGGKVLLMEENFRSTEEIVAAANAFVAETASAMTRRSGPPGRAVSRSTSSRPWTGKLSTSISSR